VSISYGALKPRSCVDFVRCSLEFDSDWKIFTEMKNYKERGDEGDRGDSAEIESQKERERH